MAGLLAAGARVDAFNQVLSRLAHFEDNHSLFILTVGEWQMRQGTHVTIFRPVWPFVAYRTNVWKRSARFFCAES